MTDEIWQSERELKVSRSLAVLIDYSNAMRRWLFMKHSLLFLLPVLRLLADWGSKKPVCDDSALD